MNKINILETIIRPEDGLSPLPVFFKQRTKSVMKEHIDPGSTHRSTKTPSKLLEPNNLLLKDNTILGLPSVKSTKTTALDLGLPSVKSTRP